MQSALRSTSNEPNSCEAAIATTKAIEVGAIPSSIPVAVAVAVERQRSLCERFENKEVVDSDSTRVCASGTALRKSSLVVSRSAIGALISAALDPISSQRHFFRLDSTDHVPQPVRHRRDGVVASGPPSPSRICRRSSQPGESPIFSRRFVVLCLIGRTLFQGTVCIGLRSKKYVVLAALQRSPNELASHQKKLMKIDDHMGISMSGLTADGRSLVKYVPDCLRSSFLCLSLIHDAASVLPSPTGTCATKL